MTVQEREYYAVVRIAPDFSDQLESGELERMLAPEGTITVDRLRIEGQQLAAMLETGWTL